MSEKNIPARDFRYYILVLQGAFAAVAICASLVIKFIGGELYQDCRKLYQKNFLSETTLEDIFGSDFESSFDAGCKVDISK